MLATAAFTAPMYETAAYACSVDVCTYRGVWDCVQWSYLQQLGDLTAVSASTVIEIATGVRGR